MTIGSDLIRARGKVSVEKTALETNTAGSRTLLSGEVLIEKLQGRGDAGFNGLRAANSLLGAALSLTFHGLFIKSG